MVQKSGLLGSGGVWKVLSGWLRFCPVRYCVAVYGDVVFGKPAVYSFCDNTRFKFRFGCVSLVLMRFVVVQSVGQGFGGVRFAPVS